MALAQPQRLLFEPIKIGTMELRNRIMMPPHSAAIGNLFGTDDEATANIAYLTERARAGVAWVGSVSALMRNLVPPGFEPTGVGATLHGYVRATTTAPRISELARAVHAQGAALTVQLVNQGGMPHGPSATLSGPIINQVPHALRADEIDWFVREYAESAAILGGAGADGVELHINHDDLHEWFLSPLTNQRTDAYGGSPERRAAFTLRVLQAIREQMGPDFTVGVRMNLRQEEPGGYGADQGIKIATLLEQSGTIDYIHGVVGTPWGNPSYIQPAYFAPAHWAPLAGALRQRISLPVVYSGRVTSPSVAEQVLRDGHADVVGVARAHIADAEFARKAKEGRSDEIRPCVGGNECISRKHVEGLPFGCAVNPSVLTPQPIRVRRPAHLVVIGGGPAGMESAALAAESGMSVTLFEAADQLGGQLNIFSKAPGQSDFEQYVRWQKARLDRDGVDVRTGTRIGSSHIAEIAADHVVVATGSNPRRPAFANRPGLAHVIDARSVFSDFATEPSRVLVVAQDDHLPPLTTADFLASRGHQVTLAYATSAPATLVGRYVLGAALARLDNLRVELLTSHEIVRVGRHDVTARHSFSGRELELGRFDWIVLACGSTADPGPFDALAGAGVKAHLIGDAFAPRRLVFATRQAHALIRQLAEQTDGPPAWALS
ncbi:FAD-dependent oxidoreductase [Nocardioides sp. YIM 152315]|uniref:oxidoreductase n=1 Tax=Nocardioides sp. YIM 152315 TaxID=3031760 RepID=UPI0023D9BD4E|nr:FAD-dependent oxidoreductase [Nocardioides sp. YIM 152315]MDF1602215.1 FAD-dependent oxidoreductase [Nocardioides sp. YIM 152315]